VRTRFVASDNTGGGHLRAYWPAQHLARSGYDANAALWYPVPEEYDVVVLHRPLAKDLPRRVARYREAGLQVVLDEDDDLYHIPKWNAAMRELLYGRGGIAVHEEAMHMATAVTVSTEPLKALYEDMLDVPVHLCPNHLPTMQVPKMPRPADDTRVLVNWAGITLSHGQDLEWLKPAVTQLLKGCTFVTIGDPDTPGVLGVPDDVEVELFPFVHDMPNLYTMMGYADIGIVPLLPGTFNEAKSWLKALEYMTQGVPVVVVDLPEQRKVVSDGYNGFVVSTPQEMAERVQQLVHDPELRREMGQNAWNTGRNMAIEHTEHWQNVLEREKIRAA